VSVINVATSTVSRRIRVGDYPHSVAFTPNGAKAYVTNYSGHNVSVIKN